jgi:shikimate kinase
MDRAFRGMRGQDSFSLMQKAWRVRKNSHVKWAKGLTPRLHLTIPFSWKQGYIGDMKEVPEIDSAADETEILVGMSEALALTRTGSPTETLGRKAREALGKRNLVFVGLMGAGKSSVGRLTASVLGIPFVDTDHEIERVSRMSINELFAAYGEPEFRALEARVIKRLLRSGPRVISTGGGAFINEQSRKHIKKQGISVWLNAELDVLWERVNKRDSRPLLKTENPKKTLEDLMHSRYPVYQLADLTVMSRDVKKEMMVEDVLNALVASVPSKEKS